jgi:3-oxoadipate enol-lactonase
MAAFSASYAASAVTEYALPEVRENLAKELEEVDPEKYLQAMEAIYTVSNVDVYPKITVPTLVMVGAEDGRTPPADADQVCSLVPESEEKVLYRCGHLALLDQPERVAAECRHFWTYGHAADD